MKQVRVVMLSLLLVLLCGLFSAAQQSVATAANATVPPLIPFASVATDAGGNSLSGVVSITFRLYAGQQGGAPLWTETQNNIQLDSTGHYSVQLGITKPKGVPTTLFTTGEARWLGVRIAEQAEQPRVLLLSVPYALKAGDAATIGGLPPSAFVLAAPPTDSTGSAATFTGAASSTDAPPASSVTGSGTADFIPLWTSTSNIGNSVLFQSVKSPFKIGINTTTPATTLDVKGAGTIRGILSLPATGTATATKGSNSQPLNLAASAFNSTSSTAVNQTFQWQSEPAGNNTSTPSGTLNLLFGEGATKPSETGFHIANNGQITFATGQTFPGTGDGTVTSVGSGAGLTGGPITSSGTLSVANAGVTNAMLQNPSLTVTANSPLSGGGSVSLGGSTSLGLKSCGANQILQFVSGAWACANPATGTVTSVGSGLGLSGGPITGSGTLTINTSVVPQLAVANTFTANQTVSGSVTATSFTGNGSGLTNVTAVNSNELGGLASGAYAQLAAANTFTANQTVTGTVIGGTSSSSTGGVLGEANAASGQTYGVGGFAVSPAGYGVEGLNLAGSGGGIGVYGSGSTGVVGVSASGGGPGGNFAGYTAPLNSGLYGTDGIDSTGGIGDINGADTGGVGVAGQGGYGGDFDAVGGRFTGGNFYCCGDGVLGNAGSGYAGNFNGDLNVTGQIFAGVKDFKIDHPLDPANKYLVHASVESSEMKNIYDGNVTTDSQGHATVQLPEWFEVLNTDFRYQLTVIGQFAQAIIGRKIENNRFEIRTSAPNVEVSWQVTGVRHDAFAKSHTLVVEQEKEARLRGFYIHPELYGAPPEKQIEWARHPQMMKQIQETQAKQRAMITAAQPMGAQPKVSAVGR
jgi:hypothetical protein